MYVCFPVSFLRPAPVTWRLKRHGEFLLTNTNKGWRQCCIRVPCLITRTRATGSLFNTCMHHIDCVHCNDNINSYFKRFYLFLLDSIETFLTWFSSKGKTRKQRNPEFIPTKLSTLPSSCSCSSCLSWRWGNHYVQGLQLFCAKGDRTANLFCPTEQIRQLFLG